MRFNPADIIALGLFIIAAFQAMKAPKKWYFWLLMVVCAAYLLISFFGSDNETKPSNEQKITLTTYGNNSPAAVTTGSNSPINISIGQPKPILDTKKDLRALFGMTNPEIIKWIDAGSNSIPVMLGTVGQVRLSELTQRPDFKKYLSLMTTSASINGNSNHIGDYINDMGENGLMSGFIFYPTEELKNN
jgi:hypothetical protein